jgi:hypothetical protein
MARKANLQTTLFPDIPQNAPKPAPGPLEVAFMNEVKELAEKLGLPALHIENYCGNKFFPKCSCGGSAVCSVCGKPVLAHCRKRNNTGNAGTPDLIGISWAVECKRDRNQRGDSFAPSIRQKTTMEKLHDQGIPVVVGNLARMNEVENFLKAISRKDES